MHRPRLSWRLGSCAAALGTSRVGFPALAWRSRGGSHQTENEPGSGAAAIVTGDILLGPVCNCLTRVNVTVHEGGGKTVTATATLVGAGQLRYQ